MAFCASCGAAVDGRFCAKCGATVAGSPPPSFASAGMTDNVAGALCYVLGLFSGIVFLVFPPYNRNKAIRFHAFQSIYLNVAAILISLVLSILVGALPFLGTLLGLFLGPLIWLGFVVLWLYLLFSTFQGKTIVLPIIGPLAQSQA